MVDQQRRVPAGSGPSAAARWGIRVALLAALGLSGYLAWTAVSAGGVAGCTGETAGCDEVLGSRWSRWFGLPVALPGASVYLTALLLTAFIGPRVPRQLAGLAWFLLGLLAAGIFFSACWFMGIQLLVLEELCPLCLMTHGAGLLAAILIALAAPAALGRKLAAGIAGGAVAATLLSLGQILGSPASYELERVVDEHGIVPFRFDQRMPGGMFASSPLRLQNELDEEAAGAEELEEEEQAKVRLLDGLLPLDPALHPTVGGEVEPPGESSDPRDESAESQGDSVVVMLFDYRCGHCRRLNRYLGEINAMRDRPLTIVPLATPLDDRCNPHAPRMPATGDACDLARLALAVWRARPAAFPDFHAWIFSEPVAPSAEEVRQQAERLVGSGRLKTVLDSGWVEQRLGRQTELYGYVGAGPLPKLLLPRAILSGTPDSAAQLERILDREFATGSD